MSAWIVSKVHIDLLVEAMTRPGNDSLSYRENGDWKKAGRENRDEIGQMLVMENVASVGYRYSEPGRQTYYGNAMDGEPAVEVDDLPGPCERYYLEPYSYTIRQYQLTWGEILRAVSCYRYQSCEHPTWEESGAHSLCQALYDHAASTFNEGPWGWEESDLAEKPKSISLLDMMGERP